MSIKIAITNEKGGCGKTTSAVNISAILAERGYRVLLADVDPQSYATMYYGLYNADDPSLYDAITGVWPVNDAIVKTVFGVDVLKSNTKSMRLEEMPTGYADRSTLIRNLKSSDGKTNIGLTNFAINALDAGSGYIYGAYGQDVTMAFLKQQQSRFFTDSDANLTNSEVNFIYETYGGKPAFDCIGLIKAYEWIDEDTGIIRYQSNGFRDVGADGMFRSAVIFGEISSIPDTPGLAVCMNGHIGIYIGNGEVIEAKSNHDGVVKTQLSEGSWTYWMQLPGITYLTGGTHPYGTKKVTLENGRIKEISAGIVAGKGEFEWPLPAPYGKDYITSGSGSRYNPVTGMYENSHGAIDIGAPAMTPIYAAADGTVVMSTWHDSYGNFVKIDHGNGWSTLYAHQTKRVAKVGESVSAGDLIGYVGSTGDSTGNHLHFEIRYNDNRLDPLQFFERSTILWVFFPY